MGRLTTDEKVGCFGVAATIGIVLVGIAFQLTLIGVVIWGIIKLVTHFT